MAKILYEGPAQTPEWFAARRGKITASRAANILAAEEGEPAFNSPIEEYHDLRAELGLEEPRQVKEVDADRKARMQWGLDSEPAHARALGELLGKTLVPFNAVIQDDEFPWLVATPDYQIVEDDELAELKAPSGFGVAKWRGAVPFGPQVQAAVQCRVATKRACTISAYYQEEWNGLYLPHPTRFERAERTEHFVLGLLQTFWQSVLDGVPPEPKAADYEAVREYSKPREGTRIDLPADLMDEWMQLEARDREMEPATEALKNDWSALKARIMVFMGTAELGIFPDGNGLKFKGQTRNIKAKEAHVQVTKPFLTYIKNAGWK